MVTTDSNKALVRRSIEEPLKGNTTVYEEVIAPSYTRWVAGVPMKLRGPEGYRQLCEAWYRVFPDLAFTMDDMVAEGDRVASRQTWRGTQRGEWVSVPLGRTIPPTGRQITITTTVISRIVGGQIVEEWEDWSELGLLRQMGAITPAT